MAQQFPPNGGRSGHSVRGPSTGGRGAGRGVPQQQSQPQSYNSQNYAAGGNNRDFRQNIGAWQAAQPTSLQQAAAYQGAQPPQQVQPRPGMTGAYAPQMPGMSYYNAYIPTTGPPPPFVPRDQWQSAQAYSTVPHQLPTIRYYPPAGTPQPVTTLPPMQISQPQITHPPPREKKPLLITDKQGNPIDFSKKPMTSSLQTAATASASKPMAPDAGAKLREAALERINGQNSGKASESKGTDGTNRAVLRKEADKGSEAIILHISIKEDNDAENKLIIDSNKNSEANASIIGKVNEALDEARSDAERKNHLCAEQSDLIAVEMARTETENKSLLEVQEKTKIAVEEKSRRESENSAKIETESAAASKSLLESEAKSEIRVKLKVEEKEKAEVEAKEKAEVEAKEKAEVVSKEKAMAESKEKLEAKDESSARATWKPKPAVEIPKRIVISKTELLSFKDDPIFRERPAELPDMTIVRNQIRDKSTGAGTGGASGGNSAGNDKRNRSSQRGEAGGNSWERGSAPPRRQSSQGDRSNDRSSGGEWSRGQAPPRQQNQNQKGRGGRGGGRGGHHQPPLYDGPVAPLVKTENHWKPRKNTSALVVAEKKVKALLNKMTKEKFDRLSVQMLEIPISSYEILTMMIDNVYDKAIEEPRFGDMYADLCVRLSESVQGTEFVHIIESDEEPPTEDGSSADIACESSAHTVYRWSNDISTSDSEVVGPLPSPEACIAAAHDTVEHTPVERGELELELVRVVIKKRFFIKIMKPKIKGDKDAYYVVYFPVSEAEELGQSLSGIFLSQVECESDSAKKNSFKRSLLNKCEEEFNKQDIYVDWKKEKKEYDESKHKLSEAERREKEEELNFRRIRIKKQMLGNVQFIGQLFKKRLLKEKIMRYCIGSLLLLTENKNVKLKVPEYVDTGETESIDEEDHEAICSLFTTIGSTIDKPQAGGFIEICFQKIKRLSVDKALTSRSRFMYKDLIELRENNWIPRRKEEKAKTIAEIRKEVELEERKQAEESARTMNNGNDLRNTWTGDSRGGGSRASSSANTRPQKQKAKEVTDEDGFLLVANKSFVAKAPSARPINPRIAPPPPSVSRHTFSALADEKDTPTQPNREPHSSEKLDRLIKSMRSDFINDGGNVNELLHSINDLIDTPNYSAKVVTNNIDALFDCKDEETKCIIRMLSILCEQGKLTKCDVQSGIADAIEFIDSTVLDAPRAYEYLGSLVGEMLRLNVIDVLWLCNQLEKPKNEASDSLAPEQILLFALKTIKKAGVSDSVTAVLNEKSVLSLLGPDKWKYIQTLL